MLAALSDELRLFLRLGQAGSLDHISHKLHEGNMLRAMGGPDSQNSKRSCAASSLALRAIASTKGKLLVTLD